MMKTLIDRAVNAWPTEFEAVSNALTLAAPWVLLFIGMWYLAQACEWLINRRYPPPEPPMRTADRGRIERESKELLWRGANGFEDTYPVEDKPEPRRRRDGSAPVIVPFPQPDDDVRHPRHVRRRP